MNIYSSIYWLSSYERSMATVLREHTYGIAEALNYYVGHVFQRWEISAIFRLNICQKCKVNCFDLYIYENNHLNEYKFLNFLLGCLSSPTSIEMGFVDESKLMLF